jgi:uncharacterized Zn-binding protein involved in type VI secretion
MSTGSHIGKRLFIAQALPATNNEVGFDALTWVEVKGVQVLPQLGVSHAAIDVPDLASGFTQGLKGAGTGNDSTMTVRKIAADAGQLDVRELADVGGQSASGSIKIVKATGTLDTGGVPAVQTGDAVQYAQGFFHSYIEIQGDTTTHEGFSVNFRQNAVTVDAPEDA